MLADPICERAHETPRSTAVCRTGQASARRGPANVIYGQLITANNQPLAAALATMPLIAIVLYLLAMRRTGALENV